jgi:small subunit ribosomal protein S9
MPKTKSLKDKPMVSNPTISTGRRKTAVARVWLVKGKGNIIINGKPIAEFFPAGTAIILEMIIRQPLNVTNFKNDYDINVNVHGGGFSGQAQAIRHGLARALEKLDATNRPAMKANGYMTRDSRMVERKKYGQKKARKKFQFSKR